MAQPGAAPSIKYEKEPKQKHHTNCRRTKASVTLRQGTEDTPVAELEATCDFQTTLEDEDATSGSENGAALSRLMEMQVSFDGPDAPSEVSTTDDADEDGWEKVGSRADKKRNKHDASVKIAELTTNSDLPHQVPADVNAEGNAQYLSSHAEVASPCRSTRHERQREVSLKGSLDSPSALRETFEASTSIVATAPIMWCRPGMVDETQIEGWVAVAVPIECAPAGAFDGLWTNDADEKILIEQLEIMFESGVSFSMQMHSVRCISVTLNSRQLYAELDSTGTQLVWTDGDVWVFHGRADNGRSPKTALSCMSLASTSMVDETPGPCLMDPRFLQNLYQGSQDRQHKPGLQFCLPSGASTWGRWTQPHRSDALDEVAAVVRVENTFITIQNTNEVQPAARRSRSLSQPRRSETRGEHFWML